MLPEVQGNSVRQSASLFVVYPLLQVSEGKCLDVVVCWYDLCRSTRGLIVSAFGLDVLKAEADVT